jgi:hypothetical protein
MSLPKIVAPTYEVKLFSRPAPVQFRPYLVKEEKLLLLAQQSGDPKETKQAVNEIIKACTFDKVNGLALPSFDFELLMLQLRARSVNNLIEMQFECQNMVPTTTLVDGAPLRQCGANVPITVDIDSIKLTVPDGHTNKIWLSETLGVELKYPTMELMDVSLEANTDILDVLVSCLNTIFTKDGTVYECKEQTKPELVEFVESLALPQIEKLRVFFDTLPSLTHEFQFKCPKCNYEQLVTLKGFSDFFE